MNWGDLIENKDGTRNIVGVGRSPPKATDKLKFIPIKDNELPEEFSVFTMHPITKEFIHPKYWKNVKYFSVDVEAYQDTLIKNIKMKNNILYSSLKFFETKYKFILPFPVKNKLVLQHIFEKYSAEEINFYIEENPEIIYIHFKTEFPFVYSGLFNFLNLFESDTVIEFFLKNLKKLKISLFNIFCELKKKTFFESLLEFCSKEKNIKLLLDSKRKEIDKIGVEIYEKFLKEIPTVLVRSVLPDNYDCKLIFEEIIPIEVYDFFLKEISSKFLTFSVSKKEECKFKWESAAVKTIPCLCSEFRDMIRFLDCERISPEGFIFRQFFEPGINKEIPKIMKEIYSIVQP